jgi:light-regulated signal transduction histidine kinase (bacteriophytochrome)
MKLLTAEERDRLCNQVEVRHLDYIQSFGYLLVVDTELKILQASENVADWIGINAEQMINKKADDILADHMTADIKNYFSKRNQLEETTRSYTNREYNYDLHIQDKDTFLILEYIPIPQDYDPMNFQELSNQVFSLTNRSDDSMPPSQICQLFTEKVKKALGFDKVLIYQFLDDESGKVVAEAKEEEMDSYLNFHFPKSDIPNPVKELYLKNPLRYIYDSQQDPVAIVPNINPMTKKPLDLSFSILKGVIPIHREYVNNMDIRTSISYAVKVRGQLWGLISCHHKDPKFMSRDNLLALAHFACLMSNACSENEFKELSLAKKQYNALSEAIESMTDENTDIHESFQEHAEALLSVANAAGAVIYFEGQLSKKGKTPPDNEIERLVHWLDSNHKNYIFHTECLSEIIPEAAGYKEISCGMVAASLGRGTSNYFFWFRPEHLSTINWGGDPEKLDAPSNNVNDIRPRQSFEIWREEIKEHSQKWLLRELASITQLTKEMNLSYLSIYYTKKLIAESKMLTMQMAADYAYEGIFILDEEGAVEWMNKTLFKLFGMNTLEDLQTPFTSLLKEHTESDIESLQTAIASKKSVSSEIVLYDKTLLFMLSPFRLHGEKKLKIFGIATDISEIKNSQKLLAEKVDELHTVNQQLTELLEVKNKFIRMAAHDLRNPISSIIMAGSVLEHVQNNDGNERADKMIHLISRQAKSMLDLLNDILNQNLLQTGQFQINRVDVDIKDLIQEVYDFHKLLASKKNIEIELDLELELSVCHIDKIKIKQVMENFLGNAIKFSPKNSVIKVLCRTTSAKLRFEIYDQGPGIPEESMETVFSQAPKQHSESTNNETHGFGLSICRQIIEAHKGELGFKNLPDKGVLFYFEVEV